MCSQHLYLATLSTHQSGTEAGQDALNFNQKENIEFVELLKTYLSNKMLPIPFDMESCCSSLLHELNYFSCLYSGAAQGNMTLITRVVRMRGEKLHVSLFSLHFLSQLYKDAEQGLGGVKIGYAEVWGLYKLHNFAYINHENRV